MAVVAGLHLESHASAFRQHELTHGFLLLNQINELDRLSETSSFKSPNKQYSYKKKTVTFTKELF